MSNVLDYACQRRWSARRLVRLGIGLTIASAALGVLAVQARKATTTLATVANSVLKPVATLPGSGDVIAQMFLILKTQDLNPAVFVCPRANADGTRLSNPSENSGFAASPWSTTPSPNTAPGWYFITNGHDEWNVAADIVATQPFSNPGPSLLLGGDPQLPQGMPSLPVSSPGRVTP